MEEIDGIIIHAIRNVGCDFDQVERLKDFSSDQVIESIVRCVWQIDPNFKSSITSTHLPPNMTSRFRMATAITSAVKELGYRTDIGYQTLLYGSETELRSIFVFLVDKLPKESATTPAPEATPMERLKLMAASKIENQLSAPWVPWFCKRLQYQWDGRFWHPAEIDPQSIPFHAHPFSTHIQNVNWKDVPATIIENVPFIETMSQSQMFDTHQIDVHLQQRSRVRTIRPPIAHKPKLPPKPSLSSESDPVPVPNVTDDRTSTSSETVSQYDNFQSQMNEIHSQMNEIQNRMFEQQRHGRELRRNREKLQKTVESKKSELSKSGTRYAAVLQNPDDSLLKLQKFANESDVRLGKLEVQWAEHRLPKQKELKALQEKEAVQGDDTQEIMTETAEMRRRCQDISEEAEGKRIFLVQLQKELERMAKGPGRSAYTRRILEIVASVRKQREEIERVLEENLVVQKDINMLTGNLDRTFTAVEEKLYKDAGNDEVLQRAYRLLVNMHECCGQITNTIEDTGHTLRELEDLQDQIETESQKSTDANLERLVNDYCQVRQENETLERQIEEVNKSR